MSIDDRRRYAVAAFITLLLVSIFWPSPIVSSNRLWIEGDLAIDELSFLGREAPSWDVVFWCIAGILTLAIVQSGDLDGWRGRLRESATWRHRRLVGRRRRLAAGTLAGALLVAATWMLLDARGAQLVHYEDFTDGEDGNFLERNCADDSADPLASLLDGDLRQALMRIVSNRF